MTLTGTDVKPTPADGLMNVDGAVSRLIPPDECLFSLGDDCNHFVYVRSGQIRVELLSASGQQLLLYRIHDGESCVMTTACLLGNNHYFAQAISETEVELILIPHVVFNDQLNESAAFREFVFNGFSARLAALMQRTTELATWSVDQRIASVLISRGGELPHDTPIALTHDQLAIDIGSAREVVSRRLAAFEKQGLIERQRGYIRILDEGELSRLIEK
jgi:CRP/FNR family transcriptional regulator